MGTASEGSIVKGEAREEWMRSLKDRVKGPALPRHVYERLATLTGLAPVVWVHSAVEHQREAGASGLTGRLVVFTGTHLFVVDLLMVTPPSGFPQRLASGTTQIAILPRAAVRRLSLTQEEGSLRNSAEVWSQDNMSGDESWPVYAGSIAVQYEGLEQALHMPPEGQNRGFGEFMATLLADLVK